MLGLLFFLCAAPDLVSGYGFKVELQNNRNNRAGVAAALRLRTLRSLGKGSVTEQLILSQSYGVLDALYLGWL
jgi:hypothetical protein